MESRPEWGWEYGVFAELPADPVYRHARYITSIKHIYDLLCVPFSAPLRPEVKHLRLKKLR
jgi:hypothetical protein